MPEQPIDLEFTVWGTPAPKGSKRAFVRGGHANVVDDNKPKLKVWSSAVNDVVQGLAERGTQLLDGPLGAAISFYLPRPSSEPKTRRTWPVRKPDLDKLVRAVLDPLTKVVIADDARLVRIVATKDYAEAGADPRPRVEVRLWRVQDAHASGLQTAMDVTEETEGGENTPQKDRANGSDHDRAEEEPASQKAHDGSQVAVGFGRGFPEPGPARSSGVATR